VPTGSVLIVRPKGVRSLDVIAKVVESEQDTELRHFDALDTKAGIALGFAGVLVALAAGESALILIGRLLAGASALLALVAFWPRGYWATNVRRLREKYLSSEEDFTRVHLLDTQIGMVETLRAVLMRKARFLKGALGALAGAAIVLAVGPAID
jgi:hypothetical protein